MRTNVTGTTTVVVNLDTLERWNREHGGETYVIEQVGYSGGHTSFVGRAVLKDGRLGKRSRLFNNIPTTEVPPAIQVTIRGAVRAHIGEQAKALGLIR
jgi:hypothetical protein